MPTEHEHIEILIPDYCQGLLEPEEMEKVRKHVGICPLCKAQQASLAQVFQTLDRHREGPVPEGYFAAVLPRFRTMLETRQRKTVDWSGFWMQLAAPAAAAIVLVGILNLVSLTPNVTGPSQELRELAGSLEPGEIAVALLDELEGETLSSVRQQEALAASLSNETITQKLLESLLGTSVIPLRTVDDLDTEELDQVLRHLEERTFL